LSRADKKSNPLKGLISLASLAMLALLGSGALRHRGDVPGTPP